MHGIGRVGVESDPSIAGGVLLGKLRWSVERGSRCLARHATTRLLHGVDT